MKDMRGRDSRRRLDVDEENRRQEKMERQSLGRMMKEVTGAS